MRKRTNKLCRKAVSVILSAIMLLNAGAPLFAATPDATIRAILNSDNPRKATFTLAHNDPGWLPELIGRANVQIGKTLPENITQILVEGYADNMVASYEYVNKFFKRHNIAKGYGPKSNYNPAALAKDLQAAAQPLREAWNRMLLDGYPSVNNPDFAGEYTWRPISNQPAEVQLYKGQITRLASEYNKALPAIEAKYGVEIARVELPTFDVKAGVITKGLGQMHIPDIQMGGPGAPLGEIGFIENTVNHIKRLEAGFDRASMRYPETWKMISRATSPKTTEAPKPAAASEASKPSATAEPVPAAEAAYPKSVETAKKMGLWERIASKFKSNKISSGKAGEIGGVAGVVIIGLLVGMELLDGAKGKTSGLEVRLSLGEIVGGTGGPALAGTFCAKNPEIMSYVIKDYAGDRDELNFWLAEYLAQQLELLASDDIMNEPMVKDAIAIYNERQKKETANKNRVAALQEELQKEPQSPASSTSALLNGVVAERLAGSVGTFS